jgi:DhnA family fructose-bisphosphate aldolase class Ia
MGLLADDGRSLIVAMDHARTFGVIPGLENPGSVIRMATEAGADAVMTSFGIAKRYREELVAIPFVLRLDGGPSLYREDWLAYTEWQQLHSVQDAVSLGATAVATMAFMGIPVELKTLAITADVASECLSRELSLLVEGLPGKSERVPDLLAADAMASAARLAFEHGADVVKCYYTGDVDTFRTVVENCPVPILIAGGPRLETDRDVLQMVVDAIKAGAAGLVFGRNIWQGSSPRGMVRALRAIVHDEANVETACDILESD